MTPDTCQKTFYRNYPERNPTGPHVSKVVREAAESKRPAEKESRPLLCLTVFDEFVKGCRSACGLVQQSIVWFGVSHIDKSGPHQQACYRQTGVRGFFGTDLGQFNPKPYTPNP